MVAVQTLDPTQSTEEILAALERDGAVIVRDMIKPDLHKVVMDQLEPWIEATATGEDDFTGRKTKRTGALVARTPAVRDLVMDTEVLATTRGFLLPYAEKIILHLTQTINIGPGQGAQLFHRDRLAWGKHLPPKIEPQLNTIWALTDFTKENGATRVVPGSQKGDLSELLPQPKPEEICQAEMSAGSVLLYSGSVVHSGGENHTDEDRLGLNITYCLGWLRQEENQYLSCPPHIAKDLDPGLQDLLGYTMGSYALGYYSDPDADPSYAGIMPPEAALGRLPKAMA